MKDCSNGGKQKKKADGFGGEGEYSNDIEEKEKLFIEAG